MTGVTFENVKINGVLLDSLKDFETIEIYLNMKKRSFLNILHAYILEHNIASRIVVASHNRHTNVFMRNSDDCIALYNHRWDWYGGTSDVTVCNSVLWADIAHPINIGGHGAHRYAIDKHISRIGNLDAAYRMIKYASPYDAHILGSVNKDFGLDHCGGDGEKEQWQFQRREDTSFCAGDLV